MASVCFSEMRVTTHGLFFSKKRYVEIFNESPRELGSFADDAHVVRALRCYKGGLTRVLRETRLFR